MDRIPGALQHLQGQPAKAAILFRLPEGGYAGELRGTGLADGVAVDGAGDRPGKVCTGPDPIVVTPDAALRPEIARRDVVCNNCGG